VPHPSILWGGGQQWPVEKRAALALFGMMLPPKQSCPRGTDALAESVVIGKKGGNSFKLKREKI